jgi:hypothetical protein
MTKPKASPFRIVAGTAVSAPSNGGSFDPIYAAIERHKAAAAVWDAAVGVRASFPEGPEPMTDEQWEERDRLDRRESAAREPLVEAGVDLLRTAPATLAGIVAAVSYIRIQMRNNAFMPWEVEFEFEYAEGCPGDAQETLKWIDAFLNTVAEAATALDKAVQS